MSLQIVKTVRVGYPTPLGGYHLSFLVETAIALSLGLVAKLQGAVIPHPPPVWGVSQDVLMARDGRAWDILRDAEHDAHPVFNEIAPLPLTRFVGPNALLIKRPRRTDVYPGDSFFVEGIGELLASDYAAAGQVLNAGSAVWFGRVIWDVVVGGLEFEESVVKHRAEWRAVLGL